MVGRREVVGSNPRLLHNTNLLFDNIGVRSVGKRPTQGLATLVVVTVVFVKLAQDIFRKWRQKEDNEVNYRDLLWLKIAIQYCGSGLLQNITSDQIGYAFQQLKIDLSKMGVT